MIHFPSADLLFYEKPQLVYLYYVALLCHLLEKDLFHNVIFFALLRISFVSESVTSLNLSNLQYGISGK